MAETLSPNPTTHGHSEAEAPHVRTSSRKSTALNLQPQSDSSDPRSLPQLHQARLFKINQKNMWELNFIDHLTDFIKAEEEEGEVETNFQKASCTLEAGVKIYSLRVDSVHSEAYKVLGGMNRADQEGQEAEQGYNLSTPL